MKIQKTNGMNWQLASLVAFGLLCLGEMAMAQSGVLSQADAQITQAGTMVRRWAMIITGVAFVIGGIFVAWSLITGQQNSRQHVIGVVTAFVVVSIISFIASQLMSGI